VGVPAPGSYVIGSAAGRVLLRTSRRETARKLLATGHDPTATYRSRRMEVRGDEATIEGDLTLAGVTAPVRLVVRSADGRLVEGSATVLQSAWGIQPYAGFCGALRLRDEVDVEFVVTLVD
jgi:polyisoprenoid-binding protein YceI